MQTNLFTKEQINRESAVGEFYEGKINYDPLLKLYFNYPGVEELYSLTRKGLYLIFSPVDGNINS